MAKSSPWELTCYYPVIDSHCDLVIAIDCIKMRWFMVAVKHAYDDSEEAADFGHEQILARRVNERTARGRTEIEQSHEQDQIEEQERSEAATD